jgi:hypothetical protein
MVSEQRTDTRLVSLSGRAFRIDWHGASSEATLANVMEKPNVDWEAAEGDVGGGGETLRVDWWMVNGHHPPDAIDFKVFGGADLAGMWPEPRTVVFEINTGAVDKLFYNPYHRQQVRDSPLWSKIRRCLEHVPSMK